MSDIKTLIKYNFFCFFLYELLMIPPSSVSPCSRLRGLILLISTSNDRFLEFKKPVVAYKSFGCNLNKRSHSEFMMPVEEVCISQVIRILGLSGFPLFYQLF